MGLNHDLNTPEAGTTDWHIPLNENFQLLDGGVEIRDVEANRDQYTPNENSKFFAVDTGVRYLGDGAQWAEAQSQPLKTVVAPATTSDPPDAALGELWYREDLDEVRTNVGGSSVTLAAGSGSTDEDQSISGDSVHITFDDDTYSEYFGVGNWRVQLADQAVSGKSLRVDMPEGEHFGSKARMILSDYADVLGEGELEEAWAQYWLYVDDSWNFGTDFANGGKFPGFWGNYSDCGSGGDPCDGTDGWSARMSHKPPEAGGDLRLGHYVYHADMSDNNGDTFLWDATPGEIDFNNWYRIDQRVQMNTPGQNDGILQGWVDGVKAFDKRDLKFRNDGFDHIKINEFWLNVYMGGGWVSTRDCHLFIDELVVSPTQISSDLEQL